ncbi:lasso peptide biosynthesis B2 protein [Crocosphaera sp. XPORK-15E]|uniref:lasso peptide biosynthesis B2 protein n=1 Tax=Crocosphaera sp. XPORK-15E TaxID=3110247 RepID=UPI002B2109AC|nr:lasso peptide biosynthesis B2 protein [Crocosphaera sp. XPORK-15E]MEA5535560.1 lasso peptide biosynthesis B2 protein [Crocosphaera sp. XPORK-15E]
MSYLFTKINIKQFPKTQPNNNHHSYQLNQDVLLYNQEGIVQLLDFNQGQFYALDRIATVMVSSLLDQGIEATITNLSQIYETTEEEIRSDLTELSEVLVNKKLLITRDSLTTKPQYLQQFINNFFLYILKLIIALFRPLINPQSDPNSLTINLLLTLSWLSFRCLGWSRTITLWQEWHQHHINHTVDKQIIETLDQKIKKAAASNPLLPIMCKERALVGYHLLRTFYHVPATLKIGINNDPFEVHAWVEYEGMILTDDPTHCQQFTPVTNYK